MIKSQTIVSHFHGIQKYVYIYVCVKKTYSPKIRAHKKKPYHDLTSAPKRLNTLSKGGEITLVM